MAAEGDIFVLVGPNEDVREYMDFDTTRYLDADRRYKEERPVETLYFSAGRREKLSRGDILGFLVKEGGA